ncbi:MAG: hypothetical protein R3Y28_08380 [Candidatus Gastranaerophilales bacterium]
MKGLKKFLLSLFVLMLMQGNAMAKQDVSFVYINGSNTNDKKMHDWFINGVDELHVRMMKQFEKSDDMQDLFFKNGRYAIDKTPIAFFWGDKSQVDLDFVKSHLSVSKALSPTLAYKVRELLAEFLHDAIWVQKSHNVLPVLDDLNEAVKREVRKGNRVVLYGYSAGSFVTYQYIFNKLPYLNLQHLFTTSEAPAEFLDFINANPKNNTCISALDKANLGIVTPEGHLRYDKNEEQFKQKYLNIDEATKEMCIPENTVMGVVNFASPLVLFFSDMADPSYELNDYNRLMVKYLLENEMFFITVNFREDPLGFPTASNLTNEELALQNKVELENPNGFIYDYSKVWSRRSFALAHTSYWSAGNIFPKAVVKAYSEGYKFQYYPEVKYEMLKKRKSKFSY